MITGYNTDVKHGGVVFHVQTEDKGQSNPFIESLVYVGGQVLAKKRASYADLLSEGQGDKALVDRMEHQHRTVIAAIRHGRFDTKIQSVLGGGPSGQSSAAANATSVTQGEGARTEQDFLAATKATEGEKTLDQVILDYLTNEAEQEQLLLVLEGSTELESGRANSMSLSATSSRTGAPVAGAEVTVKMISTVAEGQILAFGESGLDGMIDLAFEIPDVSRGTAALIITAESPIGAAELKYLL